MIPQHYPVEEGEIYGGEYPGDRSPRLAEERLGQLISKGIRTFLDLTAKADGLTPYEEMLVKLGEQRGIPLKRIAIPVPDMGVPLSKETMLQIIGAIRESVEKGLPVYIHCWGGIGRTGTAVGCWLRECGASGQEALDQVQRIYSKHMEKVIHHPESPQTPAQKSYVLGWIPAAPGNEKGGPG